MVPFNTLSIGELRAHAVKTYRTGAGSRPEVALIQVGDAQAVLKDFSRSAIWFGRILGPLLAWREARALRRLSEVHGVPRLIRQVNARALLIEHVGGVRSELFDKLDQLVREIHEHGVAHCDLRSGGNIIVSGDGQPYLIDFAAHTVRGSRWNLFWRWAFIGFCEADLLAIVRLKKRLAPELLSSTDTRRLALDQSAFVPRVARITGRSVRNISRFIFTRGG
jgi:hypothetical protein